MGNEMTQAPPAAVAVEDEFLIRPRRGFVSTTVRTLLNNPSGAVALVLILGMVITAIIAPWITWHPPDDLLGAKAAKPLSHTSDGDLLLFGGDHLGRDMYSRVIYAARVSLVVAIFGVIGSTVLGAAAGIVAAYGGGLVDRVVGNVVDALMSIPSLIIAMVIVTVFGADRQTIIIALWVAQFPGITRVVRGNVLALRERQYIDAARLIGAGPLRIMGRHLLPNVMPIIVILASLNLGQAILIEGSLSFLGFGIQPPTPSWGLMIKEGQNLMTRSPWLLIVPGTAISLAVLSFNLLGDMIRDVIDPRLRSA